MKNLILSLGLVFFLGSCASSHSHKKDCCKAKAKVECSKCKENKCTDKEKCEAKKGKDCKKCDGEKKEEKKADKK